MLNNCDKVHLKKLNDYIVLDKIQTKKNKIKTQIRRRKIRDELINKCKNDAAAAFFYTAVGTTATTALLNTGYKVFFELNKNNPIETIFDKKNITQNLSNLDKLFSNSSFQIKYETKDEKLVEIINAQELLNLITNEKLKSSNLGLNYGSKNNLEKLKFIDNKIIERVNLENSLESEVIFEIDKIVKSKGTKTGIDYFKDIENAFSELTRYDEYISEACKKYSVSKKLIYGIAATESEGNIFAYSSANAAGLMQLMPKTAREELKLTVNEYIDERFDPSVSIDAAIKYFSKIANKTGFDKKPEIALMAYNMGPTAISRLTRKHGNDWDQLESLIKPETRRYVIKTLSRLYLIMYGNEYDLNIKVLPSFKDKIKNLNKNSIDHEIDKDETMESIAQNYNTTELKVRIVNSYMTPDNLIVGRNIKIPNFVN